ncbi:hypothetical protein FHN83_00465 (plasmid) [Leclercia adecarboxylata]|nr:hypothetical protein CIG53_26355 [Enterobacter asburiae]QBB08316.1 hypothetical protein EVV94_25720 [Enterobacter cloacae]QCZ25226.1 hypothetical protein FHN83_00465 [Leclercia adecarboxylata]
MKPMLKKDFFSAIENLLKAGFQPRFYTVNSGRIGNDSNLLIVFYVQIMPDDFVMQLHRF